MANEKRSKTGGVAGALSSGVAVGATSMSSAGLADLPVIDTTNHAALTLFTTDSNGRVTKREVVYVTAHTASATTATIVKAQEGTTDQAWSTNDKWVHAPTKRDIITGRVASFSRSSTDITLNSTTWVNVDTALDMTVAAQAGDVLEVGFFARAQASAISSHPYLVCDFHTLVGGTPTTSIVTGGAPGTSPASSSAAWARAQLAASNDAAGHQYTFLAGNHLYTVQSADVSAGAVTLRLRAVCNASLILYASDPALKGYVRNLGPQES